MKLVHITMLKVYHTTIIILFLHTEFCQPLLCNYCYLADLREDCYINQIECDQNHVCSIETNLVTYTNDRGVSRSFYLYRMGCEYHSMCRDMEVSGPGPYGFATTTTVCCCGDLCEASDGVGTGFLDHCPTLWSNYTSVNAGSLIAGSGWPVYSVTLLTLIILICSLMG